MSINGNERLCEVVNPANPPDQQVSQSVKDNVLVPVEAEGQDYTATEYTGEKVFIDKDSKIVNSKGDRQKLIQLDEDNDSAHVTKLDRNNYAAKKDTSGNILFTEDHPPTKSEVGLGNVLNHGYNASTNPVTGKYYKIISYTTSVGVTRKVKILITSGGNMFDAIMTFHASSINIKVIKQDSNFSFLFPKITVENDFMTRNVYLYCVSGFTGTINYRSIDYSNITFHDWVETTSPTENWVFDLTEDNATISGKDAQIKVDNRLSAAEKVLLNDGKSPDGNKYFEDLVEQFGYEQVTLVEEHGETCPPGDLLTDYSPNQRGILVQIKYPIFLRDFKFNYEFISSDDVIFKIEKYNSGHTALTEIYSFTMSNLVVGGEHSAFLFSDSTAHNGDAEVYLRPGDYYFSLICITGKIRFGFNDSSDADKWEDNYIVALQGNATGSLPSWSALWGQDNLNWYFIFDLYFDTLNKNAGLGHFGSVIALDNLLEGSWFSYNKSGVPSRVQVMGGKRYWVDLQDMGD